MASTSRCFCTVPVTTFLHCLDAHSGYLFLGRLFEALQGCFPLSASCLPTCLHLLLFSPCSFWRRQTAPCCFACSPHPQVKDETRYYLITCVHTLARIYHCCVTVQSIRAVYCASGILFAAAASHFSLLADRPTSKTNSSRSGLHHLCKCAWGQAICG